MGGSDGVAQKLRGCARTSRKACPPSPIDTLKWHDETVWPGMQISHISLRPTETTSPTSLSVAEAPERV